MRTIKLSKMEVAYLANTRFLPEDLAQMVSMAETTEGEARLLKLDRDIAERFRDEFTTRLAKSGFGPDYEPTREGKLLEDLIDRFAARK
jgi:hypothetical protein